MRKPLKGWALFLERWEVFWCAPCGGFARFMELVVFPLWSAAIIGLSLYVLGFLAWGAFRGLTS